MSEPGIFKIACANCQGHIEFPQELHGQTTDCPHCGLTTALRVPGYVEPSPSSIPPRPIPVIQKVTEAPVQRGVVRTKGETAGVGCLVELIGLILLFFFPIGTVIGVGVMICGHLMSRYPVCSICGTRLSDKKVKLCPACKATLNPASSTSASVVICLIGLVGLVVYAFTPSATSSKPTVEIQPSKTGNSGKVSKASAPRRVLSSTSSTSISESKLLAAIPQIGWSQDQFVSAGWMKPGQRVLPKGNSFSRKGVTLFGVEGEIMFNFDQSLGMYDCSFFIRDGEVGESIGDEDWRSLYNATKAICDSQETKTGFETSRANGSIEWTINGDARKYKLALTRRIFGNVIERGLEIAITPK